MNSKISLNPDQLGPTKSWSLFESLDRLILLFQSWARSIFEKVNFIFCILTYIHINPKISFNLLTNQMISSTDRTSVLIWIQTV